MTVKRIVYSSQATSDMNPAQLVSLLESSRDNNEQLGLSGLLLYCSRSFLQVLDGDSAAVRSTFARIVVDDRHTRIRVLLNADIPAAQFPNWTMGFEHLDEEDLAAALPGFQPATSFPLVDPELIGTADVALPLLELYGRNRVRSPR